MWPASENEESPRMWGWDCPRAGNEMKGVAGVMDLGEQNLRRGTVWLEGGHLPFLLTRVTCTEMPESAALLCFILNQQTIILCMYRLQSGISIRVIKS